MSDLSFRTLSRATLADLDEAMAERELRPIRC